MDVNKAIKKLQEQLKAEVQKQKDKDCNKRFLCKCGKTHRIKDCVAVQTHWYVRPHGCIGGDYWEEGELHILCPKTEIRNRVYFYYPPSHRRNNPTYNSQSLFIFKYKNLFKTVIAEYVDSDKIKSVNNTYFQENLKKFGLSPEQNLEDDD